MEHAGGSAGVGLGGSSLLLQLFVPRVLALKYLSFYPFRSWLAL